MEPWRSQNSTGKASGTQPTAALTTNLLLLFRMERVLAEAGAIFADFQLFAARFTADGVVVIARFFADEKDNFDFFLAFGHDVLRSAQLGRGNQLRIRN